MSKPKRITVVNSVPFTYGQPETVEKTLEWIGEMKEEILNVGAARLTGLMCVHAWIDGLVFIEAIEFKTGPIDTDPGRAINVLHAPVDSAVYGSTHHVHAKGIDLPTCDGDSPPRFVLRYTGKIPPGFKAGEAFDFGLRLTGSYLEKKEVDALKTGQGL